MIEAQLLLEQKSFDDNSSFFWTMLIYAIVQIEILSDPVWRISKIWFYAIWIANCIILVKLDDRKWISKLSELPIFWSQKVSYWPFLPSYEKTATVEKHRTVTITNTKSLQSIVEWNNRLGNQKNR